MIALTVGVCPAQLVGQALTGLFVPGPPSLLKAQPGKQGQLFFTALLFSICKVSLQNGLGNFKEVS